MRDLKRTLSLTEVVFFASGVISGAGIYTIIGKAAGSGGNMLWLNIGHVPVISLISILMVSLLMIYTIYGISTGLSAEK